MAKGQEICDEMCNEVDEITHTQQPKIKRLAASELKIIISVTYNIYTATAEKLIQVSFLFSFPLKARLSVHAFKASVKRPHERRTQTEAN